MPSNSLNPFRQKGAEINIQINQSLLKSKLACKAPAGSTIDVYTIRVLCFLVVDNRATFYCRYLQRVAEILRRTLEGQSTLTAANAWKCHGQN